MKSKKFTWIIILIFCLTSVSSNLSVSQGTAQSATGSVSQTRAGTALTSLEGRELHQDMVYNPLFEQYLLVYEYVADVGEGFSYAIQAQLITSDGIPVNEPILISGPDGSARQNPAVAYNSTAGEFLVIWDQAYSPTDHDIYVQRVNTAGELVGGVIMVDYTTQDDSLPDLVYNPVSGEYLAVWERYHTDQSEVYAQRLDGSGNPVSGGGFYVADDSMDESGAAVEFNAGTGEFMVVYHIQSASDNYDIYGQRVSSSGSLSGGLIQISTASGHQLQPQLGYNAETEQFLVVWQDARTTQDIYGQFVDGAGALTGGNFAIANEGSNYRNNPQIAYHPNGREYMVTWSMNAPGEDVNIYYRRVSGDGSFPELEVLVSGEATLEERPSIAAGKGLNYLLTWQDSRDTLQQENIYGEVIALPVINTCGGVFIPVADSTAYQDDPITTHGDDDILQVKQAAESGTGQSFTYLAFDLGERIPAEVIIHSAELELTLSQAPAPADFELQIVGSPQVWDEGSLTWGNQPEWMQTFDPKSYHPVWSETEPVILRMDVSTLVNLWTTDVFTPTGLVILPGQFPMDLRFYSSESLTFKPRLVVHCSPPVAFLPQSYEDLNASQLVGIERLASQSSIPLTIHLGETGAVSYGLFDIVAPSEMTDALSRATWFTEAYADLLRLSDPGQDLQFVRYSEDEADLFFRQRYAGIPVLGSEIGIHLVGEHITGLSGSYLSDLQINPTPNITAERAREIALAIVDPRANVISDDQLRFLNRNLFGAEEGRTFLAWLVVLDVEGGTEYYIDANTGALRFFQTRAISGFDLDIETGNNHSATSNYCHMWWWTTDDDHWCDEGGCNGDADAEGISAYNNAKKLYSFWKNYLNRDSYDDDGSEIQMYIHVGSNWTNAHYVCDRFEFGDGYSVLDIIGHEFTHAVTDYTSDLVYKNESGALNESFSDIFGAFLDYGDWLIGEDLTGGAIRSLADPTLYNDPDRYNSPLRVPIGDPWDHGGVHVNSGINNHAAYLITEGGSFNGVNIPTGGIGMMRARILFYKTLKRLTSNASMLDARNAAVASAIEMYQQNIQGFTFSNICIVRNAYHAVELGDGDIDCDGIEDLVDPDQDGDKIPNSKDNCSEVSNPDQKDTDKDGLGDVCDPDDDNDSVLDVNDNCKLVSNIDQIDTDSDGFGNACDDNDDDDMVPDTMDNCPLVKNHDQLDTDNDGIGDACDNDDDNDWIPDGSDNCPLVSNSNQDNDDNDPFGDACDLCPGFFGTDNGDPDKDGKGNSCDDDDDNDGVLDGVDNCPQAYNPDQRDVDGDGNGWACDYDDAQALLDILKELTLQYKQDSPIRIPLPGCGMCGPGPLDPDYYQKINLISTVGFHAQIVDSSGKVIGHTSPIAPNLLMQNLAYQPVPYTPHHMEVRTGIQELLGITLPADGIRYYLELFPAEGVDLEQTYEMSILVTEYIKQDVYYLPMILQ